MESRRNLIYLNLGTTGTKYYNPYYYLFKKPESYSSTCFSYHKEDLPSLRHLWKTESFGSQDVEPMTDYTEAPALETPVEDWINSFLKELVRKYKDWTPNNSLFKGFEKPAKLFSRKVTGWNKYRHFEDTTVVKSDSLFPMRVLAAIFVKFAVSAYSPSDPNHILVLTNLAIATRSVFNFNILSGFGFANAFTTFLKLYIPIFRKKLETETSSRDFFMLTHSYNLVVEILDNTLEAYMMILQRAKQKGAIKYIKGYLPLPLLLTNLVDLFRFVLDSFIITKDMSKTMIHILSVWNRSLMLYPEDRLQKLDFEMIFDVFSNFSLNRKTLGVSQRFVQGASFSDLRKLVCDLHFDMNISLEELRKNFIENHVAISNPEFFDFEFRYSVLSSINELSQITSLEDAIVSNKNFFRLGEFLLWISSTFLPNDVTRHYLKNKDKILLEIKRHTQGKVAITKVLGKEEVDTSSMSDKPKYSTIYDSKDIKVAPLDVDKIIQRISQEGHRDERSSRSPSFGSQKRRSWSIFSLAERKRAEDAAPSTRTEKDAPGVPQILSFISSKAKLTIDIICQISSNSSRMPGVPNIPERVSSWYFDIEATTYTSKFLLIFMDCLNYGFLKSKENNFARGINLVVHPTFQAMFIYFLTSIDILKDPILSEFSSKIGLYKVLFTPFFNSTMVTTFYGTDSGRTILQKITEEYLEVFAGKLKSSEEFLVFLLGIFKQNINMVTLVRQLVKIFIAALPHHEQLFFAHRSLIIRANRYFLEHSNSEDNSIFVDARERSLELFLSLFSERFAQPFLSDRKVVLFLVESLNSKDYQEPVSKVLEYVLSKRNLDFGTFSDLLIRYMKEIGDHKHIKKIFSILSSNAGRNKSLLDGLLFNGKVFEYIKCCLLSLESNASGVFQDVFYDFIRTSFRVENDSEHYFGKQFGFEEFSDTMLKIFPHKLVYSEAFLNYMFELSLPEDKSFISTGMLTSCLHIYQHSDLKYLLIIIERLKSSDNAKLIGSARSNLVLNQLLWIFKDRLPELSKESQESYLGLLLDIGKWNISAENLYLFLSLVKEDGIKHKLYLQALRSLVTHGGSIKTIPAYFGLGTGQVTVKPFLIPKVRLLNFQISIMFNGKGDIFSFRSRNNLNGIFLRVEDSALVYSTIVDGEWGSAEFELPSAIKGTWINLKIIHVLKGKHKNAKSNPVTFFVDDDALEPKSGKSTAPFPKAAKLDTNVVGISEHLQISTLKIGKSLHNNDGSILTVDARYCLQGKCFNSACTKIVGDLVSAVVFSQKCINDTIMELYGYGIPSFINIASHLPHTNENFYLLLDIFSKFVRTDVFRPHLARFLGDLKNSLLKFDEFGTDAFVAYVIDNYIPYLGRDSCFAKKFLRHFIGEIDLFERSATYFYMLEKITVTCGCSMFFPTSYYVHEYLVEEMPSSSDPMLIEEYFNPLISLIVELVRCRLANRSIEDGSHDYIGLKAFISCITDKDLSEPLLEIILNALYDIFNDEKVGAEAYRLTRRISVEKFMVYASQFDLGYRALSIIATISKYDGAVIREDSDEAMILEKYLSKRMISYAWIESVIDLVMLNGQDTPIANAWGIHHLLSMVNGSINANEGSLGICLKAMDVIEETFLKSEEHITALINDSSIKFETRLLSLLTLDSIDSLYSLQEDYEKPSAPRDVLSARVFEMLTSIGIKQPLQLRAFWQFEARITSIWTIVFADSVLLGKFRQLYFSGYFSKLLSQVGGREKTISKSDFSSIWSILYTYTLDVALLSKGDGYICRVSFPSDLDDGMHNEHLKGITSLLLPMIELLHLIGFEGPNTPPDMKLSTFHHLLLFALLDKAQSQQPLPPEISKAIGIVLWDIGQAKIQGEASEETVHLILYTFCLLATLFRGKNDTILNRYTWTYYSILRDNVLSSQTGKSLLSFHMLDLCISVGSENGSGGAGSRHRDGGDYEKKIRKDFFKFLERVSKTLEFKEVVSEIFSKESIFLSKYMESTLEMAMVGKSSKATQQLSYKRGHLKAKINSRNQEIKAVLMLSVEMKDSVEDGEEPEAKLLRDLESLKVDRSKKYAVPTPGSSAGVPLRFEADSGISNGLTFGRTLDPVSRPYVTTKYFESNFADQTLLEPDGEEPLLHEIDDAELVRNLQTDPVKIQIYQTYIRVPGVCTIRMSDIVSIRRRYYIRQLTAVEITTVTTSFLFNFPEGSEEYGDLLSIKHPSPPTPYSVLYSSNNIPKAWSLGEISNFGYLMYLNEKSGRSLQDLSQYPVFPWVLKNYKSSEIDLEDSANYRDFSKPIGCQSEVGESQALRRYEQLQSVNEPPFHWGSHYSSVASVSYFLIRMSPFTETAKMLQGGKFDISDRIFSSIEKTFEVQGVLPDVKELTPEFFYCPDFLLNRNNLDLGVTQQGTVVDSVELPPYAQGSADKFIQIHRRALESEHTRKNLHNWIDLIFGYKQRGKEAVKAVNVFNPMSYIDAPEFSERRGSGESRDKEVYDKAKHFHGLYFGVCPKQLFTSPHIRYKGRGHAFQSVKECTCGAIQISDLCTAGEKLLIVGNDFETTLFEFKGKGEKSLDTLTKSGELSAYSELGVFHLKPHVSSDGSAELILYGSPDSTVQVFRVDKSFSRFEVGDSCSPVTQVCSTDEFLVVGYDNGRIHAFEKWGDFLKFQSADEYVDREKVPEPDDGVENFFREGIHKISTKSVESSISNDRGKASVHLTGHQGAVRLLDANQDRGIVGSLSLFRTYSSTGRDSYYDVYVHNLRSGKIIGCFQDDRISTPSRLWILDNVVVLLGLKSLLIYDFQGRLVWMHESPTEILSMAVDSEMEEFYYLTCDESGHNIFKIGMFDSEPKLFHTEASPIGSLYINNDGRVLVMSLPTLGVLRFSNI